MCKHVAATLYGVGVRLDHSPELFFRLRGVDHLELIKSAAIDSLDDSLSDHEDILTDSDLAGIFGIDFSDVPAASESRKPGKKKAARKKVAQKENGSKGEESQDYVGKKASGPAVEGAVVMAGDHHDECSGNQWQPVATSGNPAFLILTPRHGREPRLH